jgi:ABC-2 type transport system ATP-binding protein
MTRIVSTQNAIEISHLSKVYAGGKQALDGVSFDVPRGGVFGLLGPNGAGKSTLINILAGLVNKTGGSAKIWGFDIDATRATPSASIGIVPQELVFDPFFTPFEVLENQAGSMACPRPNAARWSCCARSISKTRRMPMPARCRAA